MASNCWQDKRIVRHIIDVGTEVNSNTGDFVRVGFSKTKRNFEELGESLNRLESCNCLANVLVTSLVATEFANTQKTYSITPNTTSVNLEVSTSVRYNVATTNIKNGEILYWTNSGTTSNSNFTDGVDQGTVEINSNVGVIDRNILRESIITEKTIVLELRRASFFSPIVATANLVTISPISISTKLYLDGKNNDSYPETGTTWFDLSNEEHDYLIE